MKTFDIINLEDNQQVIGTVQADSFTVMEQGIVLFMSGTKNGSSKHNVATMQISSSTLVKERVEPKLALVVPIKKD